ncbi:MAG: hypothetical protein OXU75_18840 [Deltaproteobacteria bacterium]|nr:hypothetical protein [Deltaproteobacteria bacterium]
MSRLERAAAILEAAETWKQRCLLDGGSVFTDERLWTREYFGQLHTHFVERPDTGTDSFEERLQRQLEPAPPEAKRLWAEMTWLYFLIVSGVKSVTKLDKIRTVWESSGATLPEDHWALGNVLERGFVYPGMAYLGQQWRQFKFIITLMLDWNSRSPRDRESLLSDPWVFAEWVDGHMEGRQRPFRHALLFLLFPDVFEPIVALSDKKAIVEALYDEAGEKHDVSNMDLVDLDKAMQVIVKRLRDERPGEEILFHVSPLKERWKADPKPVNGNGSKEDGDEAWYQARFGTADVWVIGAGEGARLWGDFQEHGIAAVGYGTLGDLGEYDSKEAIHRALIEDGQGQNPSNHSLAAWGFVHEVKVGDILIAKKGRSVVLGWGKVTGEYTYESERAEYRNLRKVEWHPCSTPITLNDWTTTKTLTRLTSNKQWLRDTFRLMDNDTQANGKGGSKDPGRRPNLNFVDMGIPIGSRLVSVKTGKEATVVSQNRVTFLGEEMSLTAATRRAVVVHGGRRHPRSAGPADHHGRQVLPGVAGRPLRRKTALEQPLPTPGLPAEPRGHRANRTETRRHFALPGGRHAGGSGRLPGRLLDPSP